MAGADYAHCECPEHDPSQSTKTFYDAEVNYQDSYCGDFASICRHCAKKWAVRIVPREPTDSFPWWINPADPTDTEWEP